jgi:hypothetical protein
MNPTTTTAALAILAITACGIDNGTVYNACDGVPYFGQVASEVPIDCKVFAANAETAAALLVQSGVVPFGSLHDFNRVNVLVIDAASVTQSDPNKIGSYDNLTEKIYLARDGRSLVHEMLHHWEWIHGVMNTDDHPDWCAKGFGQFYDCDDSLDARFHMASQPFMPPF